VVRRKDILSATEQGGRRVNTSTAVVAGSATAVSNRVSRRQQRRWAAQEQQ
jgi:hypothetical protein